MVHTPAHLGVVLMITSHLKCSFRYGKQWAQGSGCLEDGEVCVGKVLDGNFRHKGHSPASAPGSPDYCTTLLHLKEANVSPYFFSTGIKLVHASATLVIVRRSKGFLCYCVEVRGMSVTHTWMLLIERSSKCQNWA